MTDKTLKMTYSGRIIDQLGIQMYQSPVAAIAEIIANAWDADAELVNISLPERLEEGSEIVITDNGLGMSLDECEKKYLNVGYCRRGTEAFQRSKEKNRPILGRKGIGKFAGFGISEKIRIETISKETHESTVFELDLNDLRGDDFVTTGKEISVIDYKQNVSIEQHGTTIRLACLKLRKRPSELVFLRGMARRFLLHRRVADFKVTVNGVDLPKEEEQKDIEFIFPQDFKEEEKPTGLVIHADGWGEEELSNGKKIRWQICFYKKPIDEEELTGVSIFSHGKLAQSPFFFNLTGGLGGQHGQEYMSGQVEADYLDELHDDLIAPERQRIDFKNEESAALQEWGQNRVKRLFILWRERRGEKRIKMLEEKIAPFAPRLAKLPPHESRIVKRAVINLARISAIENEEFIELASSILTSWEGGRLKELISELSQNENLNDVDFVHALVETGVLTALNIAEAVKTKIEAVIGLQKHIQNRTLENPLRDYIAKNPWLIAAKWDTFEIERKVNKILDDCSASAGFNGEVYNGRIDLALSSNEHLLILEFMRPGLNLDFEHLHRFEVYVFQIREAIKAQTRLGFTRVSGYLVADGLERVSGLSGKIEAMASQDMIASDWDILLKKAAEDYREYLQILSDRSPDDERLRALL